jgi:hypothetical protein
VPRLLSRTQVRPGNRLRKQPDTRETLKLTGPRILVGFDHHRRFPWLDAALECDEDVPLRAKHGYVATI